MDITDIPTAIEVFKQEFGPIQPLEPQLIVFSWVIGAQEDNVVLARKYPSGFDFSFITKENYDYYTKEKDS